MPVAAELPTPATRNIELHVAGSITGQVAIGDNIIQVNADHGSVVNLYEGKPIVARRRSAPVLLPPRPFPGLLGRAAEVTAAKTAVRAAQPFEYYAEPGWGKTALLRYLGQLASDGYPDGVVYQPAGGQPLSDLLQFLFDAFYETDIPFKPTAGQLRQYLQALRALVILDDLDLDRDQLDTLLTSMPQGIFLLASKQRTLWGSGQAEALSGLAQDAALELFERELGRLLTAAEQPAFVRLWTTLAGSPLGLTEAAALVREKGRPAASLVALDPGKPAAVDLTSELMGASGESERKVLGLLASVYDAALPADHVAAITGIADAATILASLTRQGLTETLDAGYRLKREPTAATVQALAPQQWTEPAVEHFASWAERFADHAHLILDVADGLLKVLELAIETRQHWKEAMQLVRAVERPLAQAARWGAWQRVLSAGLQSAHALEDRAAEAWMLHQLGTRSLGLGEIEAARTFLKQALQIREALGDSEGAAVTSHNLQRLVPPSVAPPPPEPPKPPAPSPLPGLFGRLLRFVIPIAVIGAVGWFAGPTIVALAGGHATFDPPQPVDAGPVSVGKNGSAQVALRNTGPGELTLISIASAPQSEFTSTDDCPVPGTLRPGAACTIHITFTPAQAGLRTGQLTVTEKGGNAHTIPLRGTGTAPKVALPPVLDFGGQAAGIASAQREVTLRNGGNDVLPITSLAVSGDFSYTTTCPTGGYSLLAGQDCAIDVRFMPAATGARSGTLSVKDGLGTQTVALSGTGVLTFTLNPSPLDFGNVAMGSSAVRVVTLTNTAGLPLPLASVQTSTKDFTPTTGQPIAILTYLPRIRICQISTPLMPQASCSIPVRFTPVAIGPRTDALVVIASSGDQQQDSLSGVGTPPALSFNPTLVDFNGKAGGVRLIATNQGSSVVTLGRVTLSNGPNYGFSIGDDSCSNSQLSSGNSCVLYVSFYPPALGAIPANWCDQLNFVDNDPSSPQTVVVRAWGKCG